MPKHYCLDPHDPFAEREVLVTFETCEGDIRLVSAIDADGDDILSDLSEFQQEGLRRELAEAGWPVVVARGRDRSARPIIADAAWR